MGANCSGCITTLASATMRASPQLACSHVASTAPRWPAWCLATSGFLRSNDWSCEGEGLHNIERGPAQDPESLKNKLRSCMLADIRYAWDSFNGIKSVINCRWDLIEAQL